MEKAFRYRCYPTLEQESLLRRTLGCVRLVYNKALHERTQAWYERQERVGYPETSTMLTQWKKQEELDFLNEVSCVHWCQLKGRGSSNSQYGKSLMQKAKTGFHPKEIRHCKAVIKSKFVR
jgi:transposase